MPILQVMARAYTKPDGLDAAIAFYEKLFGERCKARFPIPPLGLEIASVGSVHLLAGVEEKLKPFRSAQATFWVDSVTEAERTLREMGSAILHGPGARTRRIVHDCQTSGWTGGGIHRPDSLNMVPILVDFQPVVCRISEEAKIPWARCRCPQVR